MLFSLLLASLALNQVADSIRILKHPRKNFRGIYSGNLPPSQTRTAVINVRSRAGFIDLENDCEGSFQLYSSIDDIVLGKVLGKISLRYNGDLSIKEPIRYAV